MKKENKQVTGVLLWDLSAAFDTLNHEIMCRKLEIYGFDSNTISWMNSFLTNRIQIVKIGDSTSKLAPLNSGIPQGGVLSPLLYIAYVADLEEWVQFARATTYADDTSTSASSKNLVCH
jgi:hypothetical protein